MRKQSAEEKALRAKMDAYQAQDASLSETKTSFIQICNFIP